MNDKEYVRELAKAIGDPRKIISRCQKHECVLLRKAIYYFLHHIECWGTQRIGRAMERDHSTVDKGAHSFGESLSFHKDQQKLVEDLRKCRNRVKGIISFTQYKTEIWTMTATV